MNKKRDYWIGDQRIPRDLDPPWYMDDRNVSWLVIGYFMLIFGIPALAMTFGWDGSHW